MKKIAFLGSDSTHTNAFAKLINSENSPFHNIARVVKIWGSNQAETDYKAKELAIPNVSESIENALEDIDLAMVIGRFGDSHLLPALAAIEKGIPTFIDKPFTTNSKEAKKIFDLTNRKGVKVFSSSPLRFAKEVIEFKNHIRSNNEFKQLLVSSPKNCIELGKDPRFESIFFYGIHTVEVVLEILGYEIKSYSYNKNDGGVTIFIEYPKCTATIHMVKDVNEFYSLTSYATTGVKQKNIELDGSYYTSLLKFIFEDFLSEGNTIPIQSSLLAVSLLEEIDSIV